MKIVILEHDCDCSGGEMVVSHYGDDATTHGYFHNVSDMIEFISSLFGGNDG